MPWIFGIMHPTGFPAFTILAGVFAHVFAFGTVAWRIAFFCAIAGAGSAWLVYRIARELGGNWPAALGAAWLFAFGDVVWSRNTRPEIHDLELFFMLLTIAAIVAWYRKSPPWALPVAGAAFGLALATHAIAIFIIPSIAVLIAVRFRSLHRREVLTALGALALALCTYAYLPVRSYSVDAAHLDPLVALGKPLGNAFWNTDDPSTFDGFVRLVSGSDFPTGDALQNMLSPDGYAKNGPELLHALYKDFAIAGLALALAGIAALYRRDKALAAALLLLGFFPSAFAFGYTVVADMDRYFFATLAVTAILAGIGAGALAALPVPYARAIALLPALLAAVMLYTNRHTFMQPADRGAQMEILSTVLHTPDNAIIVAPWQQATALAYGSYVERVLGHRIIDSAWYGEDEDYIPKWVARRPVYVVGSLWGEVKGYTLQTVAKDPDIYRVVKK